MEVQQWVDNFAGGRPRIWKGLKLCLCLHANLSRVLEVNGSGQKCTAWEYVRSVLLLRKVKTQAKFEVRSNLAQSSLCV